MRLDEALDKFKGLELQMSTAYLWCSITFEDLELRQFFSDMSDEELTHARALDEIMLKNPTALYQIDISQDKVQNEEDRIVRAIATVKTGLDVPATFAAVAQMEAGELNLVFESIMQAMRDGNLKKMEHISISTSYHIKKLKEAAGKFAIPGEIWSKINELTVKNSEYYKVFKA